MRGRKVIISLVIIFTALSITKVKAQDITGDTIFVNTEVEVQIKFPTIPNSFNTIPTNASYGLRSEKTSVIVFGKIENSKPAALLVSEGGRSHHFILLFKKDIDYNNNEALFKDYSSVKKIKDHIATTTALRAAGQAKNPVVTGNIPVAPPVDSSSFYYYAFLEEGDKYLKQENYPDAKVSFEKAHALRPGDIIPMQKLEQIKTKLAEKEKLVQQEKDKNYIIITAEAKTYLDQKKYTQARDGYQKALDMRPGDLYATQQLEKINKILEVENAKLEQQKNLQKASEELENNYNAAIQSADKFFLTGDYAKAKTGYNNAIGFIKRPWPQEQLKKIALQETIDKQKQTQQLLQAQTEKEKQALEDNYDVAVQSGDKSFKAGDYNNAKIAYTRALSFIKKDWPRDQVNAINKIVADQAARASAEKQRLAHEAENELKYAALIKNAETEFDKSNYSKAKNLYTDASNLKPEEKQPKERLLIIENILTKIASDLKAKNDSIALAKNITNKYNLAISNAKSSYLKNDLLNAKIFYEEAAGLKPEEREPKNQLNIIISKLAEIAKQKEIDSLYELKIVLANSQVIAKAYDSATFTYNEALSIKPAEVYPKNQLKFIQSELADIRNKNEIRRRKEEEQRYVDALSAADKAVADKRYDDAKLAYTEALAIHPDNATAKRRLEIINYQIEKARLEKESQEAQNKVVPEKKSKRKRSS